ncbi:4'-phosphopantetheinyl transferase family protein [Streptomyces viridosporus]|uniref:4'-phosphopantetheinyl transferase family protein n=1 Tax=Streptomyces viridosporus TaxID=67581 RepID=UPI0021002B4F|nr:4'-phosphopantetheinyl transferase superfamily protein [Streptomyces viridosporus]
MTGHHGTIAPPLRVDGPDAPWRRVREAMDRYGNTVVHTVRDAWSPAVAGPALRTLLGRDWPRYRRAGDPAARHRFAASRLAVKYTAAAALRTDPAELDLAYQIGGRPYLRGLDPIDISLTHTGELIAVAVSRDGRIGVDAEPVGRRMPYDLLHGRVLTPAERRWFDRLPQAERGARLLRLWTLKEAYTKALGQGLQLGFTQFGFDPDTGRLSAPDGRPAAAHGEWTFATHRVLRRYLLSVARQDAGRPAPCRGTSVHTLLDHDVLRTVTGLLG